MYCRNCGKEVDPRAAICVGCGYRLGDGENYCSNCGNPTASSLEVCLSCGFSLKRQEEIPEGERKSKLAAGLLALFLGGFGIHNFYLGFTGKGVAQILLSCTGISSIWAFVEGILILCGKIDKDAKGIPLAD